MGVNNDNPCPVCGNVYSDYAGNSIFVCRGCKNMFNNETKIWDVKKPIEYKAPGGETGEVDPGKAKILHDGGPAFPVTEYDNAGNPIVYHLGMSLRDYFASNASESDIVEHQKNVAEGYSMSRERARYEYADAMIKQGQKCSTT